MFYVAVMDRLSDASARGLAEAVSRAVGDGTLPGGTRLPPVRAVATQLQLSPSTVNAAWQLLRRAGTIHTDGRRGTVIATPRTGGPGRYRAALRRTSGFGLDLSTGMPDPALLPSLPDLGGRSPASSGYGGFSPTPSGYGGLSPAPSSYLDEPVLPALGALLRSRWPYPPERLAIFDGAMDAVDHVASALLRLGDVVLVENPCFPPLLDLLDTLGARVTGVATDESGMLPGPLAAALTCRPAAVFVQPRALNPTGASWSPSRSAALAAVLSQAPGSYVVEDDSAGELSSGPLLSIGAHLPRQTVHVRSFSKSHGPDLRLAAISGPATVLDPILERRLLGQGWTSRLLQHLLLTLLTDPPSISAVAAARDEYARRRHLITSGLAAAGIELPPGEGINLWLPVADEQAALLSLASAGIGAAAGTAFTVGPGTPPHLRITVGLVTDDHAAVADRLAEAARAATPRIPR
ncbi:aminotransferase class I/II-fold pyridoxal phosphate-dependent enzyme [Actinoplanes derwentensis]|uniref:DNA-binding transcriptional regulator, MocR family, contains an aminotransferase domain n=1 Tax=Actinoplanes derwentensis TaxID=113562 RepID=A0A1H2AC49_9ACTN|nr:aminotransferase class I/II-fold pyridoxal phosphate-dependent enzyme [Actinoplanes derwentensis]GID88942.1 GntR family transcriptional regulator [Actinoplanes derwentensis]SDT43464.1 DNA-binding transcriptional regulator, MocR family, contains an aminotransferase domain [Actinoplanes derwentensis]